MTYKLSYQLQKIQCPVIIRIGNSVTRFENGTHLCNVEFNKPYSVESIDIVDGTAIELRLVEQMTLEQAWLEGEHESFF